jgi:flagella basal body P-ring formation protein FlgA
MRALVLALCLALRLAAQDAGLPELLQEQALAYAEAQAAGLPGTYEIRTLRPPVMPHLPPGKVSFEPAHASKQDFAGPFFVSFRVYVDQRPVNMVRVDLEGRWTGKLIRTRTSLPRQAVPTPDQVEEVPFEGIPPAGAITAYPSGFQLKVPVAPGRILTRADLQPIPVISAGDPVRVALVCGPLVVSSDSVARTSGALGDRIRLELPNSKRAIQAQVTGPGEARVDWAQPGS